MKLGLIVPANLKYSPYVNYYTNNLKKLNIDYRIISWNKQNMDEEVNYSFNYYCSDFERKKILIGHMLFAYQVKKYIKEEKIDSLIIFTIAPLYFLGKHFFEQFQGRYIVDIRDDSPFRKRFPKYLKRICKDAHAVIVSSPNYSEWAGVRTQICHNADVQLIKNYYSVDTKKSFEIPISIVFAGTMIEADINIEVLKKLGNHSEYNLGFIGNENEQKKRVERYSKENRMQNVWYQGTYKKEDIVSIYQSKADLINIIRANTEINKNALPNKLYDAVVAGVPLIVLDHNEAIAHYVKKYHLGIIISDKDMNNLTEIITRKLTVFDYDMYEKGRKIFLDKVLEDMSIFEKDIISFFEL